MIKQPIDFWIPSKLAPAKALLVTCSLFALATTALAQQITGVPGSPSATQAISGEQIPAPASKFGGTIERNAAQSKPYWPPKVEPRKGAPNVLLIITDDTGYGTPSTFGGVVPTPNLPNRRHLDVSVSAAPRGRVRIGRAPGR